MYICAQSDKNVCNTITYNHTSALELIKVFIFVCLKMCSIPIAKKTKNFQKKILNRVFNLILSYL